MVKVNSAYICQQCGYKSPQYLGKCPQCDSWNSFVETIEKSPPGSRNSLSGKRGDGERAAIVDLSALKKTDYERLGTGLEEFDRVLGGGPPRRDGRVEAGIVVGSLVLVVGEPGIGKSTLLTQLALNVDGSSTQMKTRNDGSDKRVLYVAGEESAKQIKLRVDRIKANAALSVLNEVDVDVIVEQVLQFKPSLVIVDSIQTLETQDLESIAGSVGQVRECAHRLQKLAKTMHVPIFLVGHVTKEGNLAGPKTLEHVVDVVLSLEGDSTSMFRILRSTKNRFGPTDEVGIFEMEESGMIEVTNPSKVFLEHKVEAPGSAVVVTLTGIRPLVIEIQALVSKSFLPQPRRVGSGIDNNRLQLLTAVLAKRLGLALFDRDIFVNVTGGLRLNDPAVDLGVALAIVSSFKDKTIAPKTAFIGEVGLLGELRPVRNLKKREIEAKKLGFTKVISSENAKSLAEAMKLGLG